MTIIELNAQNRLDAKAALGIVELLHASGHGDVISYWNECEVFNIDVDIKLLADLLWERLYETADNKAILTAIKPTIEPYELNGTVANRDYYILTPKAKAKSVGTASKQSRWYGNAGFNAGRSDFLKLQFATVEKYYELGKEQFEQDFEHFVNNQPSILNTKTVQGQQISAGKEPFIKIGAEDDARLSGGPLLGYINDSAYSIHPIKFLLALEAAPIFASKEFSTHTSNDETSTVVLKKCLEVDTNASLFTNQESGLNTKSGKKPNLEFGCAFLFPIWHTPHSCAEILNEITTNDDYYIEPKKDRIGIKKAFTAIEKSNVFDMYSIFFNTALDSQSNFTYFLGNKMKYGEHILSQYDLNETTGYIARIAKTPSFDNYLSSRWMRYKKPEAQLISGRYGTKGKQHIISISDLITYLEQHVDDKSIEFAVALTIVRLRVQVNEAKTSFINQLPNGAEILQESLITDYPILSSCYNITGIKALQYGIPGVSRDKVENLMTILWVFPYEALYEYGDKHYQDLRSRTLVHNGQDVTLRGLPAKNSWKDK